MSNSRLTLVLAAMVMAAGAVPLRAQTIPPDTPEQEAKLIAVLESDAGLKDKVDACRGLAAIGTKKAVPALASLLTDEKLSHMARYGLEPIPDPSVDDALREALGKVKGRLLVGVIASIGVRRDAKAVPALIDLLKSPDADVTGAAARSLGRIATPEAVQAVRQALDQAPAKARPAVADGCLACAEALLAANNRAEAAAMYEAVAKADLPKHFRAAAMHGAILARQPAGKQ